MSQDTNIKLYALTDEQVSALDQATQTEIEACEDNIDDASTGAQNQAEKQAESEYRDALQGAQTALWSGNPINKQIDAVGKLALRVLACDGVIDNDGDADIAADLYRALYGEDYGDVTFSLAAINSR